ncbi:MAG: PrsW family intramembrane metalloprotease [Clostridia bacterium]|nr:PrsW family intramembrane metalloprotease [Clostridia bacterium]
MDKNKGVVARAKIVYFFKETFRAHSRAEYREIFSRGLNEDNSGVTGAYPFLYVRAFLALFILFTVNIVILRLTDNMLYLPSITFLGGITFTIPFIILFFELYPKRDIALFVLLAILVIGGTISGVLSQLAFSVIKVNNDWVGALITGLVEETCKAAPALIAILVCKQKNSYASFLIAASVGAGFSVIEDMGYIFYYSDKLVQFYSTGVGNIIILFVERGLSSMCTHLLWTGAIGWAFSIKKPYRSFSLFVLMTSILMHFCWNLPLTGWVKVVDIAACVLVASAINIAIVHISRVTTLASEIDLTRVNAAIIREAKLINARTLYTNAASFTFAFTVGLLSVIMLLLCALPIGIEYTNREFADKDEFVAYIQGGYELDADLSRKYDPDGVNVEVKYIENEITYAVQCDGIEGVDGEYFYGYYLRGDGTGELDSISVGLEFNGRYSRYLAKEYTFGDETEWLFEVNALELRDYRYNRDGSVTAIVDAEDFEGYGYLIGLCAAGVAISAACCVVLVAFRIKLRGRLKNEG